MIHFLSCSFMITLKKLVGDLLLCVLAEAIKYDWTSCSSFILRGIEYILNI